MSVNKTQREGKRKNERESEIVCLCDRVTESKSVEGCTVFYFQLGVGSASLKSQFSFDENALLLFFAFVIVIVCLRPSHCSTASPHNTIFFMCPLFHADPIFSLRHIMAAIKCNACFLKEKNYSKIEVIRLVTLVLPTLVDLFE